MSAENQMPPFVERGDVLLKELERMQKFSAEFGVVPPQVAVDLQTKLGEYSNGLAFINQPSSRIEAIQNEYGRRLGAEALILKRSSSSEPMTFEEIKGMYGVTKADIDALRPWLEDNRPIMIDALNGLYANSEIDNYRLPISGDVPKIRKGAELFAEQKINSYMKVIGALLKEKSGLDLSIIDAVPTTIDRSYFNGITRQLALSIGRIGYSTKNELYNLDILQMLRLIGHEGMGHALNNLASDNKELPLILRQVGSALTSGTAESIAQHFEKKYSQILMNPQKHKEN